MPTTEFLQKYGGVLVNLGFDLAAILVMAYLLYFRRHWRTDLLLGYIALNLGIFVTMTLLTQVKVDVAIGFGLFGILSIIRLRSTSVTQQEVAYYFLSLILGLLNGIGVPDRVLLLGLNAVLVLVMAIFDSSWVRSRAIRLDVRLEGVYTKPAVLIGELERQLGAKVIYVEVTEIDLDRNHMLVDVRLRPGEGVVKPPHEKRPHDHAAKDTTPAATDTPAAVPVGPSVGAGSPGLRDGVPRHGA